MAALTTVKVNLSGSGGGQEGVHRHIPLYIGSGPNESVICGRLIWGGAATRRANEGEARTSCMLPLRREVS
eukprot:4606542-Pyramimonas_sp.AAC.1